MEARLPAHLEVTSLIRQVQAAGGFATVIQKGERDAGTILVILSDKGTDLRAFERMPQPDGNRCWALSKIQDTENPEEIVEFIARRAMQDRDLWIIELDIVDGERFIGLKRITG